MPEVLAQPARKVPLLDLKSQYAAIRDEIQVAIEDVLTSQQFILGEQVRLLESEIAAYCQARYAVGCASGSDALILALRALELSPGDLVLTTPYSFFATAGAIVHAGARPLFADIDPSTGNLDPREVERVIGKSPQRVKAIIAVHLFGGCADMDGINAVASAHSIPVIEDAAQAIGAEYRGRRAGSMGAIGCFSFFPSKNLGAMGDGGMLTTNDPVFAERLRSLRVHGSTQKYVHDVVGYNSRLDELQAAILRVKLKYLDQWTARRQSNAERYCELFDGTGVPVVCPREATYQNRHIYNQFVICCERRDHLREHLAGMGIGTEIYYPIPLHLQKCFQTLGYAPGELPLSERMSRESLALPVYPELTDEDLQAVVSAITAFYRD